ncbi:MAG: aminotransferase class I/II-fold pyridoxal phosphate-dependent enzyme, partial [Cocleimonas sp.]|nr:aminotransferase class I/II-fold pyridoxal phosphate-dependent enzyme [Cocleimonas sp.]
AIQPIMVGSSEQAVAMSQKLLASGLLVSAIRPPTVAMKTARLRVTLSTLHSDKMVDELLFRLSLFYR